MHPQFDREIDKDTRTYLITAAQNGTPVHAAFHVMVKAAKEMGAELVVVPLRYKNPTSSWSESQSNDEVWAPEVVPYLYNQRLRLNANLILLADIKTQPTATQPLTGFESITASESGILGHTKLQLKVVPSPSSKFPKILTTTGACTKPNYTDSKAGKIGEFHHMLGALRVDIKGRLFSIRHVACDTHTGAFTDLDRRYTLKGSRKAERPLALIMGDTHVDFIDPVVEKATFGRGGIIEALKPTHLVYHDLLDGYAANPHHAGNPFNAYAKRLSGRDDVRAEVVRAIDFVRHRTGSAQSVVVPSNHDDFLRRWVVSTDWRQDPTNAEFYLDTARAMIAGTKLGDGGTIYPSPFVYWIERLGGPSVRALHGDESFKLGNIELGMHGDRGPNGSRGSIKNLRRIGIRSIIGHSHTPGIDEGCTQVGTSTRLRLEYNGGPSSWLNAHCVLHADGKRQLIFIINGVWKL